jgi:class 3 adenylate cyclase
MSRSRIKRVPRYFGLRIYLLTTILNFLLLLPLAGFLGIKYWPELKKRSNFMTVDDSTARVIDSTIRAIDTNRAISPREEFQKGFETGVRIASEARDSAIARTEAEPEQGDGTQASDENLFQILGKLSQLLIISFLLGFIFNMPFKIYFNRRRKRKPVSDKLFRFCKKWLLKTPVINASILAFAYLVTLIILANKLYFNDTFSELNRQLYSRFFLISIISSLLTILFVYFWWKHRVHIRYIEHLFTEEELRKRIFKIKPSRIKARLWTSSAMTTLLPLIVVLFYLILSLSRVYELGIAQVTEEQKMILLGNYYTTIFNENISLNIPLEDSLYVNTLNTYLMIGGITAGIFTAFMYLIFFIKWTTEDIVYPVRELLESIERTGRGELESYALVRTNDEIGVLTEGFNDMTAKLKGYIDNIQHINEANSRFVPKQFLDFLNKESIMDIKLGDQVEKEMTVLFSDIRDFTTISESMTPKENFDFLNNYLGYMEPVIRNNHGFIDKYIGDSIMALFPLKTEDALNAAIEMRIKLTEFNNIIRQFGQPAVNSGIGVHAGSLMLGVVGGEGRMDGTVISDAVNLTSRVEGLSKIYKSSVIITEDTLIRLGDPGSYNYRFIDIVKVKGKKEAVYIFELIDGEPEEQKKLKLETKELFSGAIQLYKKNEFEKALKEFKRVNEANPQDGATQIYIERCKLFSREGVPEGWDGAIALDVKF